MNILIERLIGIREIAKSGIYVYLFKHTT
jgi:hypothetical protein